MWARLGMSVSSSDCRVRARLHSALLETVCWLATMNMSGPTKASSTSKVVAMPSAWASASRSNLKSTTQSASELSSKMSLSTRNHVLSTTSRHQSLKTPGRATRCSSSTTHRYRLCVVHLATLSSSHVMPSQCFPLFPSSHLNKLSTTSTLDTLPR